MEEILKLEELKITGSQVDVRKMYVELLSECSKDELVRKVIHLTLCVEGLGDVIGKMNDVMFGVAAKLNVSLGSSGRTRW